jgi:uroporphyrinogen decarboxylase
MISTGARALHFGNRIDLLKVLEEVPQDILVMGNLDPVEVFKMSDPIKVRDVCTELLDATSEYNNFILSSGCEIPPGVSSSNYNACIESVREFNRLKSIR